MPSVRRHEWPSILTCAVAHTACISWPCELLIGMLLSFNVFYSSKTCYKRSVKPGGNNFRDFQTNMAAASKLSPILALLMCLFEGYFTGSWSQIKIFEVIILGFMIEDRTLTKITKWISKICQGFFKIWSIIC